MKHPTSKRYGWRVWLSSLLLAGCTSAPHLLAETEVQAAASPWTDLPQLPEALGGQCVGTSGDWLLVAGGSSWTAAPWEGGVKQWSDRVYGLRKDDTHWTLLGHLPYAAGYFAAATWNKQLLCAGGENATEVFTRVFQLEVDTQGKLSVRDLPPLPQPLSLARAAVSGDTLFVAGGHGKSSANPTGTASPFLALPLGKAGSWTALPAPWKDTLVIPEVAACNDTLLVAGGSESDGSASAKPLYVRNAWSYKPSTQKWTALPPLPHPVTGGAAVCAGGRWLILGGDDGALAAQIPVLREHHPGFPKRVFAFDPQRQTWSDAGTVPVSMLGAGGALWNGLVVLPGGEDRPAHRSNRVLAAPLTAFH